ncbi:putative alpha/beta superfamily hydrolase [Gelidibacter algens]|uniref:Putative alpha/beta superfamily hydrolase n=1 Tax=Gelidibacter algens TaxID=49280 RepID=A0A327S8U2_9FLAO|nr:alpha/beta hydrolase-fold protein [Gelidibacter algens]RAJ25351.1 putative alpha/beta superfamily hydrolase [Gelidibacter algens]
MTFTKILIAFIFGLSTLTHAQSTASAQVSTFTIEAPQLQVKKKIWVYLPKDYLKSTTEYPVIYMHDAQNLYDAATSYVGEWNVDESLDSIANSKVIIVGIEHGNDKRMDELTPYPNETYGGGKGDQYLDFIINTLKPQIDASYRTLKNVKHTSIFGSSLGGLLSFYAVVKYPETFGNAGIFSPSFWFSNRIFNLVSETTISPNSRFYFLAGSEESETMVPDQTKMVDLLLTKGVPQNNIKNTITEGGQHNEALWRQNFPKAYQWLIKN